MHAKATSPAALLREELISFFARGSFLFIFDFEFATDYRAFHAQAKGWGRYRLGNFCVFESAHALVQESHAILQPNEKPLHIIVEEHAV